MTITSKMVEIPERYRGYLQFIFKICRNLNIDTSITKNLVKVAGGFVRDIFLNTHDSTDIDVFVPNLPQEFISFLHFNYDVEYVHTERVSWVRITLPDKTKIQFIKDDSDNIEELISRFDSKSCMFGLYIRGTYYCSREYKIWYSVEGLQDATKKKFFLKEKLSEKRQSPIFEIARIIRYARKGWKISLDDVIEMMDTYAKLNEEERTKEKFDWETGYFI